MKLRDDFVTNSSSANFTVRLELISDENKTARSWFFACADGDPWDPACADSVEFNGDIEAVSTKKSINSICDLLYEGISIIGTQYDKN